MHTAGIGWRHPHTAALLEQRPALAFIEVHSENFFGAGGAALAVLARARAHYPVSLHGVGLALGSAAGIDPWHLDQLSALVERIEPVRVSDHACFARGALAGETVHAADLLVENLSAYLRFASSDRHETEFLVALARRTGCQLLVDVNNIYVNALNAQIAGLCDDPLAEAAGWLDSIAPTVVGELHLAGHTRVRRTGEDGDTDTVIDDHGSRVGAPVWALYRHALARFGAVPTLIEWDTDIPPLAVLLDEAASAERCAAEALAPAEVAA